MDETKLVVFQLGVEEGPGSYEVALVVLLTEVVEGMGGTE